MKKGAALFIFLFLILSLTYVNAQEILTFKDLWDNFKNVFVGRVIFKSNFKTDKVIEGKITQVSKKEQTFTKDDLNYIESKTSSLKEQTYTGRIAIIHKDNFDKGYSENYYYLQFKENNKIKNYRLLSKDSIPFSRDTITIKAKKVNDNLLFIPSKANVPKINPKTAKVTGSITGPGVPPNPSCTNNWKCTSWSSCSNGQRTRSCTDQTCTNPNGCGQIGCDALYFPKPSETQSCTACTQGTCARSTARCDSSGNSEECPLNTPYCYNNVCEQEHNNLCNPAGSKECLSDNTARECRYNFNLGYNDYSITTCSPGYSCLNGECNQKCSDDTRPGQCSSVTKGQYCRNGILADDCIKCGCPNSATQGCYATENKCYTLKNACSGWQSTPVNVDVRTDTQFIAPLNKCAYEKPYLCSNIGFEYKPYICGCPFMGVSSKPYKEYISNGLGTGSYVDRCARPDTVNTGWGVIQDTNYINCNDNTVELACSVRTANNRCVRDEEKPGFSSSHLQFDQKCHIETCYDGTYLNQCSSEAKGKKCLFTNGKLSLFDRCNECGNQCEAGLTCNNNVCSNPNDIVKPVVRLNSPINSVVGLNQPVEFSCFAQDDNGLSKIEFWINIPERGLVLQETRQVSGKSDVETFKTSFVNPGSYAWTCKAYDTKSNYQQGLIGNSLPLLSVTNIPYCEIGSVKNKCLVCNANHAYVQDPDRCGTGLACAKDGNCICTPGSKKPGTDCYVCASSGNGYYIDDGICSAQGKICGINGVCYLQETCVEGSQKPGTCLICKKDGQGRLSYVPDATVCSPGKTCTSDGTCTGSLCNPGSVQIGTCLVCKQDGSNYFRDESRCLGTCDQSNQCITSNDICVPGTAPKTVPKIVNGITQQVTECTCAEGYIYSPYSKECVPYSFSNEFTFSTGPIRTLILMVKFQNTNSVENIFSKQTAAKIIFTDVNEFYKKNSYGKSWVSGPTNDLNNIPKGYVNDVYDVNVDDEDFICDFTGISVVENVLHYAIVQNPGILDKLRNVDNVIFYVNDDSCLREGRANLKGKSVINPQFPNFDPLYISRIWITANYRTYKYYGEQFFVGVNEHEIGHTIGFDHASKLICDVGISIKEPLDSCEGDYGDIFDPMGYNGPGNDKEVSFNSYHKNFAGWLSKSKTQTRLITLGRDGYVFDETYRIYPIELQDKSKPNALRFFYQVKNDVYYYYYVEFRAAKSLDDTGGILIHIASDNGGDISNFDIDEIGTLIGKTSGDTLWIPSPRDSGAFAEAGSFIDIKNNRKLTIESMWRSGPITDQYADIKVTNLP